MRKCFSLIAWWHNDWCIFHISGDNLRDMARKKQRKKKINFSFPALQIRVSWGVELSHFCINGFKWGKNWSNSCVKDWRCCCWKVGLLSHMLLGDNKWAKFYSFLEKKSCFTSLFSPRLLSFPFRICAFNSLYCFYSCYCLLLFSLSTFICLLSFLFLRLFWIFKAKRMKICTFHKSANFV